MIQAKEIKLNNENNCLECAGFIKINFAPQSKLVEKDFDQVYLVKHNGCDVYLKLVDILILDFSFVSMCSMITLPAAGLQAHEWKERWLRKYPDTKNSSKIAVYYYKKHLDA